MRARNTEKLNVLKKLIHDMHGGYEIDIDVLDKVQGTYFGLVNTTSIMSNLNLGNLDVLSFVYDVNYSVRKLTDFLSKFLNNNLMLIDGRDMVFYQAIKSQEIWRDCTIDQEDVSNIYNEFTKIFSED